MSKVISVNAGSSSLKFQLFDMPSENVLTSGQAERIGLEEGIFTIKVNGRLPKLNLDYDFSYLIRNGRANVIKIIEEGVKDE